MPHPTRPRSALKARLNLTADEAAWVRSMVIFEDAQVMALDKPSGLSSQGGRAQVNTLDELLWAFARPGGARPRLVHRLDRETSGVILTARTKPAAAFLGKAMMARRFEKTYLALVGGPPLEREGRIEMALRREDLGREAYMRVCPDDHPDAQSASTRWKLLRTGDGASLVELRPETGRMHQLRVHMASLGRPLLGDVRYGGALVFAGAPVSRLMLHALALDFPHPDGERMRIETPPPSDFAAVAGRIGGPDVSSSCPAGHRGFMREDQ